MQPFSKIVALALRDHAPDEIAHALDDVRPLSADEIAAQPDDRILSQMAYRVFCSGFSRKQIDARWPFFEEAFWHFAPGRCAAMNEAELDALLANKAIVRNGAKIASVRDNAQWVLDLAERHGSASRFFAEWSDEHTVELLDQMKRQGSRLGGETGMRLLRDLGKPTFVLIQDVITALIREGVVDSPPNQPDADERDPGRDERLAGGIRLRPDGDQLVPGLEHRPRRCLAAVSAGFTQHMKRRSAP